MYGEDPTSDDALGFCEWGPDGGIPYAWRYTYRELIPTKLNEQHSCPQFKNKNTENIG